MVRPYLRGRRRYILIRWDPVHELQQGALIALVRQRLNPLTDELQGRTGAIDKDPRKDKAKAGGEGTIGKGQDKGKTVRPGMVRFDPPWAAVVVDHRLQEPIRAELNTLWQGVALETVATSGTLKALWKRTGRSAPPARH